MERIGEGAGQMKYLDGRYFDIVFKDYPGRVIHPFSVDLFIDQNSDRAFADSNLDTAADKFVSVGRSNIFVMRIIVSFYSSVFDTDLSRLHGAASNKLLSRHSNLLIFNDNTKEVYRFEPLKNNIYDEAINNAIINGLKKLPRFKGYSYKELNYHSQEINENIGLCVAHIIAFLEKYLNMVPMTETVSEAEIEDYAARIVEKYGALPPPPEIEFGFWGGGFGLGFGLLAGTALIGAAAAASQPRTTIIYR